MIKHSLSKKGTFRERVIGVVKAIPRGETLTYGDVALKAGHAKAARAVGAIMRTNKDKDVPCHRVVAKGGIGGYNGLKGEKKKLLREEGVAV